MVALPSFPALSLSRCPLLVHSDGSRAARSTAGAASAAGCRRRTPSVGRGGDGREDEDKVSEAADADVGGGQRGAVGRAVVPRPGGAGAAERRRDVDVPGGGAAGAGRSRAGRASTRSTARSGAGGCGRRWPPWSADDVVEVAGPLRRRFFSTGGGPASRVEVEVTSGRMVQRARHSSRRDRMSTPMLGLGWNEVAFSGSSRPAWATRTTRSKSGPASAPRRPGRRGRRPSASSTEWW